MTLTEHDMTPAARLEAGLVAAMEQERAAWQANSEASDAMMFVEQARIPEALRWCEADDALEVPGAIHAKDRASRAYDYAPLIDALRAPSRKLSTFTSLRTADSFTMTSIERPRSPESFARCAEIVAAWEALRADPDVVAAERSEAETLAAAHEASRVVERIMDDVVALPPGGGATLRARVLVARYLADHGFDAAPAFEALKLDVLAA